MNNTHNEESKGAQHENLRVLILYLGPSQLLSRRTPPHKEFVDGMLTGGLQGVPFCLCVSIL